MKRKLASIILAIMMTLTIFPMTGSAAPKNGDPLGDILYSDIMAYIDNNAIPTSIKSGTTLVVVEDLARYGFDVIWNGADRTLRVERNANKPINPIPVIKDTTHAPGTFKCKYVYTDIKTYLSGQLVESFAINGQTLIDFELLAKYGKITWYGLTREIKLTTLKVGDPMGDILYSDIMAYIDTDAIPSSIKAGTTLVVVEDLARYGFDVTWNNSERTLKVERNLSKPFNPIPVVQDYVHTSGTFKCKYFYTDIKTYLSGQLVESFAVNGQTMIDFELMAKYGAITWHGWARAISLALTKTNVTDAALRNAVLGLPQSNAINVLWNRLKGFWNVNNNSKGYFAGFYFDGGAPSFTYGLHDSEFIPNGNGKVTGCRSTGAYTAEFDIRFPPAPPEGVFEAIPAKNFKITIDFSTLISNGKIKMKISDLDGGIWIQYYYCGMTFMDAYDKYH